MYHIISLCSNKYSSSVPHKLNISYTYNTLGELIAKIREFHWAEQIYYKSKEEEEEENKEEEDLYKSSHKDDRECRDFTDIKNNYINEIEKEIKYLSPCNSAIPLAVGVGVKGGQVAPFACGRSVQGLERTKGGSCPLQNMFVKCYDKCTMNIGCCTLIIAFTSSTDTNLFISEDGNNSIIVPDDIYNHLFDNAHTN